LPIETLTVNQINRNNVCRSNEC